MYDRGVQRKDPEGIPHFSWQKRIGINLYNKINFISLYSNHKLLIMGVLLRSNGIREDNIDMDGLQRKQELVGGYIELVHLNEGRVLIVNEEGLLNKLPLNTEASGLCGGPIVGDVILCNINEIE